MSNSFRKLQPGMKHLLFILVLLLPFTLPAQKIVSITIDGSINPASASYIERGISKSSSPLSTNGFHGQAEVFHGQDADLLTRFDFS